MLEVASLQFRWSDRLILDIESLRLSPGELCVVMGANGAGKTTLLRILAKQQQGYSGRVLLDGRDALQISNQAYARQVQYIFQQPMFLSGSVQYNLARPLLWLGHSLEQATIMVAEGLERFSLSDKAQQSAASLSGGEAQRVSLLRALLLQPRILLVDEPTANVDEQNAKFLCEELSHAVGQGKSIMVVTHDPALAHAASRRLTLNSGRLVSAQ